MKVVHFELTLSNPQLSSEGVDDRSAKDVLDSRAVICWRGLQTDVDVLMPDRHMDIRFSVTDAETLTSGEGPVELQTYLADLHAFLDSSDPDVLQPNPPLTLNYEGIDYILDTSASVRQSKERAFWILRAVKNQPSVYCHATICPRRVGPRFSVTAMF
ncbi:hypothetical protein HETIRDRAFT_166879 [Heterobasidion irregulare TC 32-1]|uniref:Uncharacterized protein n=1 Tax=Heterobasidion irregulare (strain TC 32-1) TaxID=747525 RepID=W4KNE2_HETIT|nr:uncharacterized protein HETIRDRAFT_166879 [Heterobasidion irregulare TC 32-1]ETW87343.1 hypothetical protein HETIRDRAFT_166879 [Heterobasidion irregulare TC 32-1]